jgi:hypothetical protein
MLIAFKVKNFLSFHREQSLSFKSSPDRSHLATHCVRTGLKAVPRLSKVGVLFGPNGAGKSNLIHALATMKELVLHSTGFAPSQFAEHYQPCQGGAAPDDAIEFEIDVFLQRVRYQYSFSYDAECIRTERLLVFRTGKSQRWFERKLNLSTGAYDWSPFSPSLHGPREMWRRATRPKSLFLTTAAQLNAEPMQPLFQWFDQCLKVLVPREPAEAARAAPRLEEEPLKRDVVRLLNAVDLHIADLRIKDGGAPDPGDANGSAPRLPQAEGQLRGSVDYLHADARCGHRFWLSASREAAGVQRLVGLFAALLVAREKQQFLVIDDFDANLHPLIARFLIGWISDSVSNGAQALLTSHNTTLMDLDILRRDEIWLVQQDDGQCSELWSLQHSRVRKREWLSRGYLGGRYGAIPAVHATHRATRQQGTG